MLTPLLIALGLGYLLGSLPFGYLVARAKGVNIFEVGSRNPGATNVRRVLGKGPGNLVFALDAVKGAMATSWPIFGWQSPAGQPGAGRFSLATADPATLPIAVAGLVGAMLGHSFSCFTRFRGGKGVATGAGGFLVIFPLGAICALVIWGATLALSRYVSLASMVAAVSLPILSLLMGGSHVLTGVSAAVALFVLLRHRANIGRILAGTEAKVGRNKEASP